MYIMSEANETEIDIQSFRLNGAEPETFVCVWFFFENIWHFFIFLYWTAKIFEFIPYFLEKGTQSEICTGLYNFDKT